MKKEDRITKACCDIRWERSGSRLRGQENHGYYVVVIKKTGYRYPHHFTSKREASAWLGKQVMIANKIKAGIIRAPKKEGTT